MNLVIVGLNHKTSPIEIREKLSFPSHAIGEPLKKLVHAYGLAEGVILSTCNRVEVLAITHELEKGTRQIKRFLSDYHSIPLEILDEHLYVHQGEAAVKHLFRVASGLDSMVLGEPQILGQVKDSYGYAVEHNTAGIIVNKLYHKAFQVSKTRQDRNQNRRVRRIHKLCRGRARQKDIRRARRQDRHAVGAGEMAELAARHLQTNGVREIIVANRTYEKAVELVKCFSGTAIMFREYPHYLKNVDIVIASTASPNFIIKPDQVHEVMKERRHKPMFFIDISVPRNVDPLVNNIDNCYVYDVDDLQGVVVANLQERHKEAEEAEQIIVEEIDKFYRWIKSLDVVPTIIALRQECDAHTQGRARQGHALVAELEPQGGQGDRGHDLGDSQQDTAPPRHPPETRGEQDRGGPVHRHHKKALRPHGRRGSREKAAQSSDD